MTTDQSEARTRDVRGLPSGAGVQAASPCPTPDDVVRYVLDILDEGHRTMVDDHLATCVDCRIEVEALREALDATLTPEG
jgi:hypothetical protein